jgi:hypothetical protein
MKAFVLIVIISNPIKVDLSAVEFGSKQACEIAGAEVLRLAKRDMDVVAFCTPKEQP